MPFNSYPPRSPEGLRKGGHTRGVNETAWGCVEPLLKVPNAPAGGSDMSIGSHGPAASKPLAPGSSEGNPKGFGPAGKGRR
jgi:hypothetical protein